MTHAQFIGGSSMRDYHSDLAAFGDVALDDVTATGVNSEKVFTTLENGGVAAFGTGWRQLPDSYPRTRAGTPPRARPVDRRGQPTRRYESGSDVR
jgi:hypothetical protein